MKFRTLLTTLLTLTFVAATLAQAPALDQARLDQFFDQLAAKNQAMGSLVIAREGKVLYARSIGFGQIDGAEKKPLTAASRFRIGSITKMFTAVIVFQLAEEKKLSLDDTLDKYLPEIPNASKITLAHILRHRSGIPNVFGTAASEPWRKTDPITPAQTLARIAKATPDFEPDTKYQYSNTGYTVLGFIIEKVTGQPYPAVVQERILSRLGLRTTYVSTGEADVSQGETLAYQWFPAGWKQNAETHATLLSSAGAIVSTPSEMATFFAALFAGKLVSPESLAAMKPVGDSDGMGMSPPFKWEGKTFFGETGGGDNRGAWLAYLPEEKLAIAYATNAKVHPVDDIMKGIAAIYYGRPFALPTWEKVTVPTELLQKYAGVYVNAPARFTLSVKDSLLYIQPGTGSATPMEPKAENRFEIAAGVTVEFDLEKKTDDPPAPPRQPGLNQRALIESLQKSRSCISVGSRVMLLPLSERGHLLRHCPFPPPPTGLQTTRPSWASSLGRRRQAAARSLRRSFHSRPTAGSIAGCAPPAAHARARLSFAGSRSLAGCCSFNRYSG